MKNLISKIIVALMCLVEAQLKLIQKLREINKVDMQPEQSNDNHQTSKHSVLVKVGEKTTLPHCMWVVVKNPKGRKNGNGFFDFGDSVLVQKNGTITIEGIESNSVLVSYTSPNNQGYGSEAGNGTLFFVKLSDFVSFPQLALLNEENELAEKSRITNLLAAKEQLA